MNVKETSGGKDELEIGIGYQARHRIIDSANIWAAFWFAKLVLSSISGALPAR